MQKAADHPDFSSPWHMSDVVLVVEDQHLHVHRGILSMCSPVFETMFTGDFKEKHATEIPLPDKIADQVREMLLVLYPTAKPVNESSVHFLLPLAQEYQIDLVTKRCEEFLLWRKKSDDDVMKFLFVAQTFGLEDLHKQCVEMAKSIKLKRLQSLKDYNLINCEVGKEIAVGRVVLLEGELGKIRTSLTNFLRSISTSGYPFSWEKALKSMRKKDISTSQVDSLMKDIEETLSSSGMNSCDWN